MNLKENKRMFKRPTHSPVRVVGAEGAWANQSESFTSKGEPLTSKGVERREKRIARSIW